MVKVADVRRLVPEDMRIVRLSPGRTLAMLALMRYGAGSTLQYQEAIIAPALVHGAGRIGMWISHIYVDHPQSLLAGREVWGLPKESARFAGACGRQEMDGPGVEIRIATDAEPKYMSPCPLAAAIFGRAGRDLRWSLALGRARMALVAGGVRIIHAPAIEALQFDRVRRLLRLARFDVELAAPRVSRSR